MQEELRLSREGDEEGLRALWRRVFGDTEDYIDGFFKKLYRPGSAAVLTVDGEIVSAAYIVKLGDFVCEGRWTPCREVYAYGTHPDHRGRGYGGRVLDMARRAAMAGGVAVVCPAEPPLIQYYEKNGFSRLFYAGEFNCTDVGLDLTGSVTRVTVRGYAALREELLHGRPHIDFDSQTLEYQEQLCTASGGGLYYVVSDGVRCCAAAEVYDGKAYIRELVVPTGSQYNAAALVARAVRAQSFIYRSPVRPGEKSAPFAMICSAQPVKDTGLAWFGFAFD